MPKLVAIDLGTANVKASVWNVSGRKASFVERLIEPVPQDGTMPTLEVRLAAVRAMLEAHADLAKPGVQVGATASGRDVSVHRVTMPFTDKRQLEKTLPFAVEAEVPFDLDEMVLGWRVLSQDEGTEAMVSLAEESSLRLLVEGLGEAKLDPRSVIADKELLARWAVPSEPEVLLSVEGEEGLQAPPLPVVAVLDVGHTRSVVVVVRDGVLLGSRVVDIGGASITRLIQRGLNCSWANAERLKHGLPPQPDPEEPEVEPTEAQPLLEEAADAADEVDEADTDTGIHVAAPMTPWDQLPEPGLHNLPLTIRDGIDEMVARQLSEVRATLISFEDTLGIEVDAVRLGGGGARLDSLAGALQDDLGVPVMWASGLDGSAVPCEHLLADSLAEILAGQVSMDTVNLRTGALRYRSGFNLLGAIATYGGALVLFFTLAMIGLYAYQSYTISAQTAEVQARADSIIKAAIPDEEFRRTRDALNAMNKRIKEAEQRAGVLGEGGVPPTTDMHLALATTLPPPKDVTVDVTSLSYSSRALEFEAEVDSYGAAAEVEVALQASERFKSCTKSNEQQRREKVTFNVLCEFDKSTGEEG